MLLLQVAFQEMVDRQAYYKPLLAVVDALCQPAFEAFLAGDAAAQDSSSGGGSDPAAASSSRAQHQGRVCSIAGSLRGLQKGAHIVRKELSKALEGQAAAAGSSSGKVDKQTGDSGADGRGLGTELRVAAA